MLVADVPGFKPYAQAVAEPALSTPLPARRLGAVVMEFLTNVDVMARGLADATPAHVLVKHPFARHVQVTLWWCTMLRGACLSPRAP